MKGAFVIVLLLASFSMVPKLSEIRELYPKASDSKEVTDQLFDKLEAVSKDDNATLVAYTGAIYTLKAKFAKGIKNKKDFFKSGKELIEHAIATKPNDIEIRCIRLGVQENSPKVVKYKENITADKQFILDHYHSTTSKEIKTLVKNYILQSSIFDSAEKQLF